MMKKQTLPSILLVFIILISDAVIIADAAKRGGVKAVILYTYDESTSGSSVVTMEVDKDKFMTVLQESQTNAIDAKPLKFVQNNGFFDLLEGDSSQFSFATTNGMADCDCKCLRRAPIPTTTTRATTTRPPTTTRATTQRTTTTRKPDCPNGGILPYCCSNGANNQDCCQNNGKGPYCCTNGANNPNCELPTKKPDCPNGGRLPYCCENGANNVDCCLNNGKGPNCELPTQTTQRPTTTTRLVTARTSTQAPTYLPPLSTSTLVPCPNGGSGPFCCKNNANNPDCCANNGKGPYCCLNNANNKDCCENNGSGPFCCTNGANNIDCCTNGGKGKYCCTNGAETPDCSVPKISTTEKYVPTTTTRGVTTTTRPTTRRPDCQNGGTLPHCCENGANNKDCCVNGGKGKYCCTNGANNPNCELPVVTTTTRPITTTKFRGPSYLPIARVTTERPSTTTATYTYGSRPTYTYRFSFTNGAWTYIPRSTHYTTRETTTTAKYAYDQHTNGISYNGADNLL
ncbi:mucin-5AC-like [Chironomus tepperi]|uniref:mucin-5AC-like n=1 Tax=Chironomus tepperi TaxID=113505 RepID=UPI00391F5E8C